jgi:hypothetical protein
MGLGQKMSGKEKAIKAAKAFEFYVKYLWPVHRLFALNKISKRCRNCAASEKMISIGSHGVCSLCEKGFNAIHSDINKISEEKNVFENILKKYEGTGSGNYDALVLYSGGKDSSYLVRRIKDEFPKLRLLTFTIDNGFMSPVAKENIEFLIPKLQVDHIFVRPKKEFYIKLFKYALTHLNEDGCYGTVDFSDGEFMLDSARNLAAEKKIPLILCGYSRFQVQNGLKLQNFESPREVEYTDRTQTAGLQLRDIFDDQEIQKWWRASKWPQEQIARLLFPLYCWDLEESEIIKKVTEWGLVSPKKYSPIVTNHQLIPLLGVVDVHRFGFSSFEKEFCRMIREGKAEKEHWQKVFEFLEYTSRTGLFVKPTVLESLEQLDLSLKDVGIKFN